MIRWKRQMAEIADLDNLYLAFWKARRGKDAKPDVITYRKCLDKNLLMLQQQILEGNVEVGNYHYFTIYDPKERVICAAPFSERVLHHALMNVCHPIFERFQIYDSYATRVGKGTYAALDRAAVFHRKNKWYLKLDVRKYFASIDQNILFCLLKKRFKNPYLLQIFEQLLKSYQVEEGKGLPIGNLTSQYFANYYLAFADRYIKERLKISAYVRYMDDMVLWSNDKPKLLNTALQISAYLQSQLQLSLKEACLNKSMQGLSFLGYRLFNNHRILNRRSKKRFEQKLKIFQHYLDKGMWSQQQYKEHLLPLLAFTQQASSKTFRQRVLNKLGQ